MSNREGRRERLRQLIDLALAYQSASKSKLAGYLERDRAWLYRDTDNPKLDLLVGLAEALEWSLETVVDYVCNGEPPSDPQPTHEDYQLLDKAAVAAHCKGDYKQFAEIAQRMIAAARTPDQRARAWRLQGIAWSEQARLPAAPSAYQRGLEIRGVSPGERLALQSNVANAHYNLWELTQAIAVAHLIVDWFADRPPTTRTERVTQAFAFYIRGNALRRMFDTHPADVAELAARAQRDLERAEQLYLGLKRDFDADYLGGIAHTCRGGLLEVEVELGLRDPEQTVDEIRRELSRLDGDAPWPEGDWLESYGWWCDFGANIALRHFMGRKLQRHVGVFCEKLLAIGRRCRSWPLLERAASIAFGLHEQVSGATGLEVPYTLDTEDLKLVAGVLGRFPRFRRVGWKLVGSAVLVRKPVGTIA